MSHILQPTTLGDTVPLQNCICMGSMTRNHCVNGNKPTQSSTDHYAERVCDSVSLIVVEGTFVYLNGGEWPHALVMFDHSHVEVWKKVTDTVHCEGGKIIFQMWHPSSTCPEQGIEINAESTRLYPE